MKNILLIKGGGSTEHEISLISAQYIKDQINSNEFHVVDVEIDKNFTWRHQGEICQLNFDRTLQTTHKKIKIDIAIPCIHGFPGETGDIQSFFELIKLPYLGCNPETNTLCFNKLATKVWLEKVGVPTSPFMQLHNAKDESLQTAETFLKEHHVVYVKATNQGSSVGCYRCQTTQELKQACKEAFEYSPFVIIEKEIKGREVEVSAFEYENKLHITLPGEIECPSQFYSYEEKYNKNSETKTHVEAPNLNQEVLQKINKYAFRACQSLKVRHLSRLDFFVTESDEVILNEINTFPGHTKISMFPMMMENYGVKYSDFINSNLKSLT